MILKKELIQEKEKMNKYIVPIIIGILGGTFFIWQYKYADSDYCEERRQIYHTKIKGIVDRVYETWDSRGNLHIVFKDSLSIQIELEHATMCFGNAKLIQKNDSIFKEKNSLRFDIYRNGEYLMILDCSVRCSEYGTYR